jgi:hypothetical protein
MTGRFDEQRDPLAFECPECGADAGKRCRKAAGVEWAEMKRERYGLRPPTRYQHVKPHPARVSVAWRKWLEVPAR